MCLLSSTEAVRLAMNQEPPEVGSRVESVRVDSVGVGPLSRERALGADANHCF